MTRSLIFPDGVRLARREEIPGPDADRVWARIEKANIQPGFDLKAADDSRFSHYAEINADSPAIWDLVCELSRSVLGAEATLLMGAEEEQPVSLGSAPVEELISLLAPYRYGLAHDGFLRFGLMSYAERIAGLIVEPTKCLKVWMTNDEPFLSAMAGQNLARRGSLEFLEEYANVSKALSPDKLGYVAIPNLMADLTGKILGLANPS